MDDIIIPHRRNSASWLLHLIEYWCELVLVPVSLIGAFLGCQVGSFIGSKEGSSLVPLPVYVPENSVVIVLVEPVGSPLGGSFRMFLVMSLGNYSFTWKGNFVRFYLRYLV